MANIRYDTGTADDDFDAHETPFVPPHDTFASYNHQLYPVGQEHNWFDDNSPSTTVPCRNPAPYIPADSQQHYLLSGPFNFEPNDCFDPLVDQLSHLDMDSQYTDGQETLMLEQQPSSRSPMTEVMSDSSRFPTVDSPDSSGQLRCTFPSCTAKDEDKVFTGKGATSAHKRHMDSHTRPYICPDVQCPRHTNGFSRRDNLTSHKKTHENRKNRTQPLSGSASPLGVIGGSINATRRRNLRGMSGQERRRLMNTLLICVELGFDDEEEENDPENEFGVEGMEEDDD
ncbi:hypothetical protein K440DRAFT_636130 [Wilcoxina mikolae CBS 423.85]|nr:hypothetical protein K440DRAFT_636130 [Wilcoxina mikolae CBS 423.85]